MCSSKPLILEYSHITASLCPYMQNMPAWKKGIVRKRREEQAVSDAIRQQQQEEWDSKMAEIAAMPPWKRKIFLERNPQYDTNKQP